MTKTIKKGLVACLIALMAVLVGITAAAWSGVNAEDQTNVDKFLAAIDGMKTNLQIDDTKLDEWNRDKLFPETDPSETFQKGWNFYIVANGLYTSVLTDAEKQALSNDNKMKIYNKIDSLFGDAMAVYAGATSSLYNIANPPIGPSMTYKDNAVVTAVEEAYTKLTAGEKKFIDTMTKYTDNLAAAKARMVVVKEKIDAAITAIDAIQFYKDAEYKMEAYSDFKDSDASYTGHRIVVDSNTTIEAATEAIEEIFDQSDVEMFVDNYAVYTKAVADYAVLTELSNKVDKMIADVNAKVNTDTCYTLKAEIEAVQKEYEALAAAGNAAWDSAEGAEKEGGGHNYNDLQKSVYSRNTLEGLISRLATIEAALAELDKAIDEIPDIEGTESAVEPYLTYTVADEDKIKKAEDLYKNLDADIKAHDDAEFEKEGAKSYFVEKYEDMKAARAQYDAWGAEVNELRDKVEAMMKDDAQGHSVYETYYEVLEKYGAAAEATTLTKEQREALSKLEVNQYNESGTVKSPKITVDEAMTRLGAVVNKAMAATKTLDASIAKTYAETVQAEKCVFGQRKVLGWVVNYAADDYDYTADEANKDGYWQQYLALDDKTKEYVQHLDMLKEMLAEVDKEMTVVNAWYSAVDAIETTVKVTNWDKVDAAVAAWKQLVHGKEVLADALGGLQTIISTDIISNGVPAGKYTSYKAAYGVYAKAVQDEEALKTQINELVTAMTGITLNPNLPLTEVDAFHTKVTEATAKFEALADKDVTAAWMSSNYKAAWDNYQNALAYDQRYGVESEINKLYANDPNPDDPTQYVTDPAKLVADKTITLANGRAIAAARDLYEAYIAKVAGASEKDIRNYTKLVAAEEAIKLIAADLDAWMRTVIKLDKDHADFADDANLTAITTAIDEITKNFKGYPLDLTAYDTVLAAYNTVKQTGGVDDAEKIAYLKPAKDLLDKMDLLGGKNHEEAENIIKHLNDEIQTISDKVAAGTALNADDLAIVKEIQEVYDQLHTTQQALIENIESIQQAADELAAQEAFGNMLTELYRDVVTDGNVTSLSRYNLAVVEAIYDTFSEPVKETLKSFTVNGVAKTYAAMVAEIREKIDAAETAGEILSLKKVEEEISEQIEGAINDIVGAFKGTGSATTIQDAIKAFKQDLEIAYKDAIKTAIDSLKNGEIEAVQGAIDALEAELASALDAGKSALAKDIKTKIDSLRADLTAAQNKITELEGLVGRMNTAEGKLTELDGKITSELGKLENSVKSVTDSAKQALDSVDALRKEMQEADAKLQEQIDSMSSSVTTLTVLIIVIAVLLVAAIACVVVLFLKRKKD